MDLLLTVIQFAYYTLNSRCSVAEGEPKKIKITIKPAAEKTTASLDEFRSIQLTLPTPPVWVSIIDKSSAVEFCGITCVHYKYPFQTLKHSLFQTKKKWQTHILTTYITILLVFKSQYFESLFSNFVHVSLFLRILL